MPSILSFTANLARHLACPAAEVSGHTLREALGDYFARRRITRGLRLCGRGPPAGPDTAWFVPAQKDEQRIPVDARLVVTRTRNGGTDFAVLRAGLPDGPTYDLVYRHALGGSADGERLAFGSTTGGLWVSEDAGSA